MFPTMVGRSVIIPSFIDDIGSSRWNRFKYGEVTQRWSMLEQIPPAEGTMTVRLDFLDGGVSIEQRLAENG